MSTWDEEFRQLQAEFLRGGPDRLADIDETLDRLDKGTVMEVRKGAFRANARWYNLEFRCEIDATATSVIALDFDVGAPVPRAEWKSRGFPGS
jgi:hypothetical protein